MAKTAPGPIRYLIQRILDDPRRRVCPDGDLLQRFLDRRDEVAFEEILARHGPMVFDVCRALLSHEADAEDAFQATFLVLAKKAASIRKTATLGGWLYGVAYRTALKAKAAAARRREHEARVPQERRFVPEDPGRREVRQILHEELSRLSERHREPLVLCYLQGRTQDQAAALLGMSKGTLKRRLEGGRTLLRERLVRRGLGPAAVLLAPAGPEAMSAGVPPALVRTTAHASRLFAIGGQAATAPVSPRVLALTEGGVRPMLATSLKLITGAALALGIAGAGLFFHQPPAGKPPEKRKPTPAPAIAPEGRAVPEADRAARTDRHGDPLPEGAIARIGTLRFRAGGEIAQVAFSPDGRLLVAAGSDDAVTVWEAATGKQVRRLAGGTSGSEPGVAFSPDGKVLAAARYGEIRRRDTATWKELPPFRLKDCTAGRLLFSPDGKVLASVGTNRRGTRNLVILLDAASGRELHRLAGLKMYVAPSIAFAPDSSAWAYADRKASEVTLYDTTTGREIRRFAGHRRRAAAVAFSPDGKTLASTDSDGNLRFWEVATGKLLPGAVPFRAPEHLAYSPDGKLLAGGGHGRRPQLWDVAAAKPLELLQEQRGQCEHIVFSPDGKRLASYAHQALYVWDVATGKTARPFQGHEREVWAVAFSPDGRRLATAAGDYGFVRLWEPDTGKELPPPAHKVKSYVYATGYSPDGKLLAVGGGGHDRGIWLLDAATGKQVRNLKAPRVYVTFLAFSADGRVVLGGGSAGVEVWDVATGKHLRSLPGVTPARRGSIALSPDGRTVAEGGGEDGAIRLWDVATATQTRRLAGHRNAVYDVTFSPDGRRLASAGEDGTVRLWDPDTGGQLWQAEGDRRWVRFVAFSPDGRMLASGGGDGEVRLWEVATGQERTRYRGHRHPVRCGAFSADGTRLATGSHDTTVLVWDVRVKQPEGTKLSREELEALWTDLSGADAGKAYRAIGKMAATPAQSVPFLKEHLRPVEAPDPKRVARLLADLDSKTFAVREKATRELEKLGPAAEPPLRTALEGRPGAEARRRVKQLLEKLETDPLSQRRAIEVLEHIGSPEARQVLRSLADGAPHAWLTREAQAALRRLKSRTATVP